MADSPLKYKISGESTPTDCALNTILVRGAADLAEEKVDDVKKVLPASGLSEVRGDTPEEPPHDILSSNASKH